MPPASTSAEAVKKAGLAALVALVLAIPFIGVRLEDVDGRNGLAYRPLWVAIAVAVVFAGRFAMELGGGRFAVPASFKTMRLPIPKRRKLSTAFVVILGFAVVYPFTPFVTRYELDLATTFLIYVMLGFGLNIVVGLAGLLDLG
ncbi:DUF3382 domain-containing protein, partial [Beijerinckia sp. L45]|uniref:DUF3382 domain-containing protein n=1 Tax=Beijerinckia sp. L45 TaxID=1641855 RepID=UPI00131AF1E9